MSFRLRRFVAAVLAARKLTFLLARQQRLVRVHS